MKPSRKTVGEFDVRVWSGGAGSPVLYLHGWEQHPGAAPFLEKLGQKHEVLAPEHPGYGSSTGFEHLHDIHDLILYYRSLIQSWGKGPVDVIGHSFGGMIAAELAVLAPQLVRRLVLVSPYGLWLDDHPLPDPFVLMPDALAKAKWHDPAKAANETSAFDPAEGDSPANFRTINLTTASKFLWPIPDRGLSRRLPYVTSPTLVIHGESDGLVPANYEKAWTDTLPSIKTARIKGAAHMPMFEAEDAFVGLVDDFLA
jgi:pimeloyl-ACP methyl ester carboxylesterase